MTLLTHAGVAVFFLAAGYAAAWLATRRRGGRAAHAGEAGPVVPEGAVPYTGSTGEIAAAVDMLMRARTGLRLLAVYAGRDGAGALDARWRASDVDPARIPASTPAKLLVQLEHPKLIDAEELVRGLTLGLPPAAPEIEASQLEAERVAEKARAAAAFHENPFELEDSALTEASAPAASLPRKIRPVVDAAAVAARLVAVRWSGPFDWQGLLVAEPEGANRDRDLAWTAAAAGALGERLGVYCEVADRIRAESRVVAAPEPTPAPAPAQEARGPEPSPADERVRRAELRMAEVLQTPRREAALVRATVGLLAEGLAPDRCYAVEVEGLHTRPIEHERRTEAAASALSLDFGQEFLQALKAKVGATIKAITLDANTAAEMVPGDARERLGAVSRMLLPVLDKGRIVVVFVAEWIDLAKRWNEPDVTFAERVAARAAVARERILQYEAIAEQAAHARASQEQVEEALEQLQALMASIPDGLVGLDAEGRITFTNRAAAGLFGHREFELMGRWISEAASELDGDAAVWERILAAESVTRFSAALVSGDAAVDLTVVPSVPSDVCDRLVTMVVRDPAADVVVAEMAEPLGRLLSGLELIAGGAHGDLSTQQEAALEGVRRLGVELRTKVEKVRSP